jgi:hypothetical protein
MINDPSHLRDPEKNEQIMEGMFQELSLHLTSKKSLDRLIQLPEDVSYDGNPSATSSKLVATKPNLWQRLQMARWNQSRESKVLSNDSTILSKSTRLAMSSSVDPQQFPTQWSLGNSSRLREENSEVIAPNEGVKNRTASSSPSNGASPVLKFPSRNQSQSPFPNNKSKAKNISKTSISNIKCMDSRRNIESKGYLRPRTQTKEPTYSKIRLSSKPCLLSDPMNLPPCESLSEIVRSGGIDRNQLRRYLYTFGSFPDIYRTLLWRFYSQIPENRIAFNDFMAEGTHVAMNNFHEQFPIKSTTLSNKTFNVLNIISHWAPPLSEVTWLPYFVFPWVEVMGRDTLVTVEICITLLLNLSQKWMEYFPNPPVECLIFVDALLAYFDPALHHHLHVNAHSPGHVYAWPLMQTLFSDILHREAWLKVWDYWWTAATEKAAVLPPPVHFYLILVALLRYMRVPLLQMTRASFVYSSVTKRRPFCIATVLSCSRTMTSSLLKEENPDCAELRNTAHHLFSPFCPIPKGTTYPIFTGYPVAIVNYARRLHARIRADEEAILRSRRATAELEAQRLRLLADAQSWRDGEQKTSKALARWWDQVLEVEQLYSNRARAAKADTRQAAVGAMDALAKARRDFVSHRLDSGSDLVRVAHRAGELAASRGQEETETQTLKELLRAWHTRAAELGTARAKAREVDQVRLGRLVNKIANFSDECERDVALDTLVSEKTRLSEPNVSTRRNQISFAT